MEDMQGSQSSLKLLLIVHLVSYQYMKIMMSSGHEAANKRFNIFEIQRKK
jgi:hypothetical protein